MNSLSHGPNGAEDPSLTDGDAPRSHKAVNGSAVVRNDIDTALTETLRRSLGSARQLGMERAIVEVRAGRPVIVNDGGQSRLTVAAELIDEAMLPILAARGGKLVLPAARLRHLGVPANAPMLVSLAGLDAEAVADLILSEEPRCAAPHAEPVSTLDAIALELVRAAALLPAAVVAPGGGVALGLGIHSVERAAVEGYHQETAKGLSIAARAPVPLADSVESEFVVFRGSDGLRDQVAIVIGAPAHDSPVLIRLHSACLTGDLFGSLKCDCGEQLRGAVAAMQAEGGGILLYLDQEGRGIGLRNKIRAYRLQGLGYDTLEADALLGFDPDHRRYTIAGQMLRLLDYRDVVVMTNNPRKITALGEAGINVTERRPILGRVNEHNRRYLETKAARAGHMLDHID